MLRTLKLSLLIALPLSAAAQRQRATTWESGMLDKGEKAGVWEYFSYSSAGERVVTQRYDHTIN